VTIGSSYTQVAQLSLPAGNYVLFGKAAVQNDDTTQGIALCNIQGVATPDIGEAQLSGTGTAGALETMSVQAAVTLTTTTNVTLDCAIAVSKGGEVQFAALTAIAVDQLN
jgi:hypothetical protein